MGGRWRRKKKQELLVVGSEYRERRRSYWLWAKKIKSEEEIIRKRKDAETAELWRKVRETDGFDMGELRDHRDWGMHEFSGGKDCLLVVQLYAKVGLHRYNVLEGTNLQLHEIEKYNREGTYMPARYYITLLAAEEDPSATPASLVTFQTELYERKCCTLNLTCLIARLKGTKSTGNMGRHFRDDRDLPEWPDDKCSSRFLYEVMESEWEENDWIGLYLQVAIVTTDRRDYTYKPNLSGLKILNVVVETEENLPKETLLKCFPSVVVYISYDQDLGADNGCLWTPPRSPRNFHVRWLELEKGVISTEEEAGKKLILGLYQTKGKTGQALVDQGVTEGGVNGAEQIKPSERKKDDELVSKGSVRIIEMVLIPCVFVLTDKEDGTEGFSAGSEEEKKARRVERTHRLDSLTRSLFIEVKLDDLTLLELKPKKAVAGKPVGRGRGRGGAGRGRVR
ncbi:hypothetical protein YC2023_062993 [Brassica napus]